MFGATDHRAEGNDMLRSMAHWSRVAVAAAVIALAAACSGGTYSRGLFMGYVIGFSAEEVESKVGKPATVQTPDANRQRWVYEKKTFDPDNNNAEDATTTVIFERKDGKLVAVEVLFG
jgi:hypothetical protein